jgi:hypothetical protein
MSRRRRWVHALACALLMPGCVSAAVRAQPAQSASCRIVQKPRVYVALGDDVELERYEDAAAIATQIMRQVQAGVCAQLAAKRRKLLPDSLRAVLGRGQLVELESVQFSDSSLQRAYVLLRSEPERRWRVQLRSERGWRIDSIADEPSAAVR